MTDTYPPCVRCGERPRDATPFLCSVCLEPARREIAAVSELPVAEARAALKASGWIGGWSLRTGHLNVPGAASVLPPTPAPHASRSPDMGGSRRSRRTWGVGCGRSV